MEMGVRNVCRRGMLGRSCQRLVAGCAVQPRGTREVTVTGPFEPAELALRPVTNCGWRWRRVVKPITHRPIYYPYQLPVFYVLSVMMNTRTFPKATSLSVLVCYSYEWN
jgi:hypothetical protein